MIAFAVLPVFAVLIAAPASPEEGCPSARQVADAMQTRFPISLVMPDQQLPARSDVLRALLEVAPDGSGVRFSLIDVRGETHLRRTLPAARRGQPNADCLALADTLAAIVERYLATLAYETTEPRTPIAPGPPVPMAVAPNANPPNMPPRPRGALVMVGVGWRMPGAGPGEQGEIEGRLGAAFDLTRTNPRLAGVVSAGAAVPRQSVWDQPQRTATLRRFPLRLGALLELPAGPGWVEPALELGVDLLMVSSAPTGGFPAYQTLKLGAAMDAAIGYRLKVAGRFYIRPRAAINVAFTRYDIGVRGADTVVFNTPWASASFGIDTGVLFQ